MVSQALPLIQLILSVGKIGTSFSSYLFSNKIKTLLNNILKHEKAIDGGLNLVFSKEEDFLRNFFKKIWDP